MWLGALLWYTSQLLAMYHHRSLHCLKCRGPSRSLFGWPFKSLITLAAPTSRILSTWLFCHGLKLGLEECSFWLEIILILILRLLFKKFSTIHFRSSCWSKGIRSCRRLPHFLYSLGTACAIWKHPVYPWQQSYCESLLPFYTKFDLVSLLQ